MESTGETLLVQQRDQLHEHSQTDYTTSGPVTLWPYLNFRLLSCSITTMQMLCHDDRFL